MPNINPAMALIPTPKENILAKPNPGHIALANFEENLSHFELITQNVDGLHQAAGSRNITELHGNISRNKCHSCGIQVDEKELDFTENSLPHCHCGGLIRPDIVWFGEMLPEDAIEFAWETAITSDVFFSIGTSAVVFPAASLPVEAKRAGAFLVEINPDETELTSIADISFRSASAELLDRLACMIKEARG